MGFERAYHHILDSKIARIRTRGDLGDFLAVIDQEFDPVLLNGGKMRAARDGAHLMTGQCQFDRQVAADRTGAVDAKSHVLDCA
jgi:hypothetical protein